MKQKKVINMYSFEIRNGECTGYFNIYQARNGSIQLLIGNCNTTLTYQQILDLNINVYELIDYDHDNFIKFYKEEIK